MAARRSRAPLPRKGGEAGVAVVGANRGFKGGTEAVQIQGRNGSAACGSGGLGMHDDLDLDCELCRSGPRCMLRREERRLRAAKSAREGAAGTPRSGGGGLDGADRPPAWCRGLKLLRLRQICRRCSQVNALGFGRAREPEWCGGASRESRSVAVGVGPLSSAAKKPRREDGGGDAGARPRGDGGAAEA